MSLMTVVRTLENDILIEQAKKFGTPLYIYDADLILIRYKELYEFIKWPKLRIYYALKANYNIGILKMLAENKTFIETVSPSEIKLAMSVGFPKEKILYTANNITDEEKSNLEGYLNKQPTQEDVAWDLIEIALKSIATLAIIPFQDVINLGSEARMNTPGTAQHNWGWRLEKSQIDDGMIKRLRALTQETNRAISY